MESPPPAGGPSSSPALTRFLRLNTCGEGARPFQLLLLSTLPAAESHTPSRVYLQGTREPFHVSPSPARAWFLFRPNHRDGLPEGFSGLLIFLDAPNHLTF